MTLFSRRFNNADERNAVIGDWEKEYTQTAPGRFCIDAFGRIGNGTLLLGEDFHGAAHLDSTAGRESCHLIWLEGAALRINGSDGWHREIAVVAAGAHLEAATPAGARALRLSFFGDTADRLQSDLQGASSRMHGLLGSGVHRSQIGAEGRARFGNLLSSLEGEIARRAGAQWSDACQASIDDSLYSAALAVLLDDRDRDDAGTNNNAARRQLALRAKSMLHETDVLPLTVSELCKSLGASERMLELSFRAQFGVCARRFMIALRLQRAHRALATADPNASVTSIATDLGFWHLGRFSQYYQQMFGVLPSSTLRLQSGSAIQAVSEWRFAIDSLSAH